MANKLTVHLDLDEIVLFDAPAEIKVRREVIGIRRSTTASLHDASRPQRVAAIVRSKYRALANELDIQAGKGVGSHRCIKARYVHGISKTLIGRSAQAVGRMAVDRSTPYTPHHGEGHVSGYVYEGAILAEIEYHLLMEKQELEFNNIIGAVVAHELGHNLGVEHSFTPFNIMYVYASDSREGKPNAQQKLWLTLAEQGKLEFTPIQIQRMRLTLAK